MIRFMFAKVFETYKVSRDQIIETLINLAEEVGFILETLGSHLSVLS